MNTTEKINALITASNTTTGGSATDLTAAISALISGYGGGGGLPTGWATGEFTLAKDTGGINVEITHGLGKIPNYIFIYTTATALSNTHIRSVCYSLLGETEYPEQPAPYNWQPDDEFVRTTYDTSTSMANVNLTPGGTEYTTNRETFFLPSIGSRAYYAGGVTYKWIAIRMEA